MSGETAAVLPLDAARRQLRTQVSEAVAAGRLPIDTVVDVVELDDVARVYVSCAGMWKVVFPSPGDVRLDVSELGEDLLATVWKWVLDQSVVDWGAWRTPLVQLSRCEGALEPLDVAGVPAAGREEFVRVLNAGGSAIDAWDRAQAAVGLPDPS